MYWKNRYFSLWYHNCLIKINDTDSLYTYCTTSNIAVTHQMFFPNKHSHNRSCLREYSPTQTFLYIWIVRCLRHLCVNALDVSVSSNNRYVHPSMSLKITFHWFRLQIHVIENSMWIFTKLESCAFKQYQTCAEGQLFS